MSGSLNTPPKPVIPGFPTPGSPGFAPPSSRAFAPRDPALSHPVIPGFRTPSSRACPGISPCADSGLEIPAFAGMTHSQDD